MPSGVQTNCIWKIQGIPLKCNPTSITYYSIKMKSQAGPPVVTDSYNFPPMVLEAC
jgi:hypothetical protein